MWRETNVKIKRKKEKKGKLKQKFYLINYKKQCAVRATFRPCKGLPQALGTQKAIEMRLQCTRLWLLMFTPQSPESK